MEDKVILFLLLASVLPPTATAGEGYVTIAEVAPAYDGWEYFVLEYSTPAPMTVVVTDGEGEMDIPIPAGHGRVAVSSSPDDYMEAFGEGAIGYTGRFRLADRGDMLKIVGYDVLYYGDARPEKPWEGEPLRRAGRGMAYIRVAPGHSRSAYILARRGAPSSISMNVRGDALLFPYPEGLAEALRSISHVGTTEVWARYPSDLPALPGDVAWAECENTPPAEMLVIFDRSAVLIGPGEGNVGIVVVNRTLAETLGERYFGPGRAGDENITLIYHGEKALLLRDVALRVCLTPLSDMAAMETLLPCIYASGEVDGEIGAYLTAMGSVRAHTHSEIAGSLLVSQTRLGIFTGSLTGDDLFGEENVLVVVESEVAANSGRECMGWERTEMNTAHPAPCRAEGDTITLPALLAGSAAARMLPSSRRRLCTAWRR